MHRRAFLKLTGAAGVSVAMGSEAAAYDASARPMTEVAEYITFQAEAVKEDFIIDLDWTDMLSMNCASVSLNQELPRNLQVSIESADRTMLSFLEDLALNDRTVRIRHKGFGLDEPARVSQATYEIGPHCVRLDLDLLLLGGY